VLLRGSERSEFPDLTNQIAKAKAMAKVRGRMLRACTGCGRYYDENGPEAHVCPPRSKSKKVKCRKCGEEVDVSCLKSHLRQAHPPPWWPNHPPKGVKVRCRYCGQKMGFQQLKEHSKRCYRMRR
jgi:ribosomal protein S27E